MNDSALLERVLEECAREPIQHSGAIQPGGFLLACDPTTWTVRHVSANAPALFGLPAEQLLGQPLDQLLDETLVESVRLAFAGSRAGQPATPAGAGNLGPQARIYELGVHRADDLVHLEIEPQGEPSRLTATGLSQQMIEIHEPVRILFVIETSPEAMLSIMSRHPIIDRLVRNDWVQLALVHPAPGHILVYKNGKFEPHEVESTELPQVRHSIDWYRGWRDHLAFASIEPTPPDARPTEAKR